MRRVVELFAGVGSFRVGLNEVKMQNGKVVEKKNFHFVFFNQWEPNKQKQHALNCYSKRFNEKYNKFHNIDISLIDKKMIQMLLKKDHNIYMY